MMNYNRIFKLWTRPKFWIFLVDNWAACSLYGIKKSRSNKVTKAKLAGHQLWLFSFDLNTIRKNKLGRNSHYKHRCEIQRRKGRITTIVPTQRKHVLKLGEQIKMSESPEQSGQFSLCSTHTLILFLILYFPLPLLPALEICPSAITSQSKPLPGFLCFAKAN